VPFHPLGKPLSECRIALITTAAPYQPDKGDQDRDAPYNATAKFYNVYSDDAPKDHDLRISPSIARTPSPKLLFCSPHCGSWRSGDPVRDLPVALEASY
jgi:hypothetical protein